MERYADIVLPLAQPAYTYAVADGLDVEEGQAVAVQFGARRIYTGIVWRIHGRRPDFPRIKTVSRVLYDRPLLDARQRALWEWMADYYLCTLGEVMRFALPQTIKPSGNSEQEFADREYRPRTELYAALDASLHDEERFHDLMERLSRRAPRQYAALLAIASAEGGDRISTGEVPRRLLEADAATLAALQKKGLVTLTRRERSVERGCVRFQLPDTHTGPTELPRYDPRPLRRRTPHRAAARHHRFGQDRALHPPDRRGARPRRRRAAARARNRHHGAAHRAARTHLRQPRDGLPLEAHARAPHRKLPAPDALRRRGTGRRRPLGALSAAAAPATDRRRRGARHRLQQTDAQPRYNARDVAVVMARLREARTVLGSATPSLESYANALSGKYGLATLDERYGDARPPLVLVSDTLRAVKRNERKTHFNRLLLDKLADVLARGEQAMLFQNRRGFAPYVECRACGWTACCPRCNVTLTYHKRDDRLQCHYCGHVETVPVRCPACRAGEVTPAGFGTEKVEEELARLFPAARIERLDRDTATSERAYRAIIDRFESGQSDLLVGTQMITKGFDFARVSLVGILNADNLLFAPDFRAAERAFQLMTQVAGRAGRRDAAGEVVIQTTEPEHPVIRQVAAGDYEAMARTQLAERRAFAYPPYARLIRLTLRQRDRDLLYRASAALAVTLRGRFGRRAMGPVAPPVDRIREEYITEFLLKIESGASASRAGSAARGAPADARCERVPKP